MAGNGPTRFPCSRRLRWWVARLTTVFGIGVAALAACQPFRDSTHGTDAPVGISAGAAGKPWRD